jgi:ABC-type uncharacterized transport system involved in gliding motility auxiliary subunit
MKRKSLETILYSTAGVALMALILVGVNLIFGALKSRIDLTQEKAYTLSAGTKAILHKLDTPVTIRLYSSQGDSSPQAVFLKSYGKRVEDLLSEYKQIAKGKLVIEKYDPQPDSDAEDNARLNGVEGEMLPNGEKFYLGLSVTMLDEKQTLPFLDPNRERLLEYDLSRAISRVMNPEKPVVGIMSPLPLFGMPANPMMMRMGQQGGQEPWAFVTELKNDFNVQRIEMDADSIPSDVKVLLVVHPREITDKGQYAIDQFVLRGGKLIAFLDPLPVTDTKEQNQMLGSIPNSGSNLDKLLKAWGLSFDTGKVVADLNYKVQLGGRNGRPQEAPAFLSITSEGINNEDIVTSQIDNIWLPFAGAFTGTPADGLKETVLIKSSKDSQLVDGFMANLSGENILKEFKPSGTSYAMAVRLTGKFKTAFPNGKPEEKKDDADKKDEKKDAKDTKPAEKKADDSLKASQQETSVVLVGDADMLFDRVAFQQVPTLFGPALTPANGNVTLVQNAVEQLTGDNNLISVRSRATQNRPFTLVKKMQAEAESNYRNKIKELEDSLADTQRQLNELQQKKEKGQRFVLSPEQQKALENFREKEAKVKIQLKDERKKLRRDIDSLESRLKLFNIAAMPLLVCASGLSLAFLKRKRTSAK